MSRFVRASKYRHVYGTGQANKRDQCYDNIRVSRSAWDTNLCKVNGRFLSVNLESSGGGQFLVVPLQQVGKLPAQYPVFEGHTSAVLDTDFHPFHDSVIASCAEDGKVLVWQIPDNLGETTGNFTQPSLTFNSHSRKVGHVLFHPTAENVLLSSGADLCIKLYDVQKGLEKQEVHGHPDIINSIQWNWDGSLLATTCKDKKLRLVDPRDSKVVAEVASHPGVKNTRVCWMGDSNRVLTTGFSKTSDRQYMLWDSRNMKEAMKSENLDTMSGGLIPYYDNDTKMLYLAGKGDGNIRYYEMVDEQPFLFSLSEYKSSDPQRGLAFMPKRYLNVSECEIARVYKVHTDRVEPISFKVPRKSEQFQADIYPDTVGDQPSLTAQQWFSGKNAAPKLISLEKGFQPAVRKEFVTEAPVVVEDVRDPLKNPQSEKEYQDAFHSLRRENEQLKNETAQKDVRIRQLELQLEQLMSNTGAGKVSK